MDNTRGQKRKGERGICDINTNKSIVQPLKRHITRERKQLERMIYALRAKLYLDVEQSLNLILDKILEVEHSVELIAQELSRRNNSDGPER